MILGPVMLELGLHPLVTASTSLLLVGASSSSATVGFALADRLDYGWGIIMFVLCVIASTVGVAGIGKIVRRSGKASLIVFLLVFIMFAGGLLTAVSSPCEHRLRTSQTVWCFMYTVLCSLLCSHPRMSVCLHKLWNHTTARNGSTMCTDACRSLEAYMLSATFMMDTGLDSWISANRNPNLHKHHIADLRPGGYAPLNKVYNINCGPQCYTM